MVVRTQQSQGERMEGNSRPSYLILDWSETVRSESDKWDRPSYVRFF